MNWLLITTTPRTSKTFGSNVGDEFARLGIQKLIAEVDPDATLDLLDKETPDDWGVCRKFHLVVICGMPMFWSNSHQSCQDIFWWDYLWNSYITGEKHKVLPCGIGHVLVGPPHDQKRYDDALAEVTSKSWRVVAREPIYNAPGVWVESVCPSAFCMMGDQKPGKLKLCTLMESGGHFGYLTPNGELWSQKLEPHISNVLMDNGFDVVAHTHHELDHATSLGWPRERIHLLNSAQGYLDLYRQAACYFGNRMHGAAVVAARRAPTWGMTHDSRLGMVSRLGGKATVIDESVNLSEVESWIAGGWRSQEHKTEWPVDVEYVMMRNLFRQFAQQ